MDVKETQFHISEQSYIISQIELFQHSWKYWGANTRYSIRAIEGINMTLGSQVLPQEEKYRLQTLERQIINDAGLDLHAGDFYQAQLTGILRARAKRN